MRRYFLCLLCCLSFTSIFAQEIILKTNNPKYSSYSIRLKIVDSENGDPIQYATAYLQPASDTTITHFEISSTIGEVMFTEVPYGKFVVNVEMMGYKHYQETYKVPDDVTEVLNVILEVDNEFLEAATVSSFKELVEFSKDTIIYNAVAFRVSNTAMLEDLVKRMPGLELIDGRVISNGKPVNEITVNGRTFFFGDQMMALSSLPAKFVNKIKIIDNYDETKVNLGEGSETTKVMDIELKEQFSKGIFGDVSIGGGIGDDNSITNDETRVKCLAKLQGMLCKYKDSHQFTVAIDSDNEREGEGHGEKIAANFSTDAIPFFTTDISMIASHSVADDGILLYKYSFSPQNTSYDKRATMLKKTSDGSLKISASLRLNNSNKNSLEIKPYLFFNTTSLNSGDRSEMSVLDNTTETFLESTLSGKGYQSGLQVRGSFSEFGKDGRKIAVSLTNNNVIDGYADNRKQVSDLSTSAYLQESTMKEIKIKGGLSYIEPLTKNLYFETYLNFEINRVHTDKEAEDGLSHSSLPAFSSYVNSRYIDFNEFVLLTYSFPHIKSSIGARFDQISNSVVKDKNTDIGKAEFELSFSPYIMIQSYDMNKRFWIMASPKPLDNIQVLPMLSVINSSESFIGNIWLRPSRSYDICADLSNNSKLRYHLILRGLVDTRPVVSANWFDDAGKRYSFPVNSLKPGAGLRGYLNLSRSFGDTHKFMIRFVADASLKWVHGYQSVNFKEEPDPTLFDYSSFLSTIWGNQDGDIFYSGKSGFSECLTSIKDIKYQLYFNYRSDKIAAALQFEHDIYLSNYSFAQTANQKYRKISIMPEMEFDLPWDFYGEAFVDYSIYKGLGWNLDRNVFSFGLTVSRDIGIVTLSLEGLDLLNKNISIMHFSDSEFIQTSLNNYLGRSIMLKAMINFGKSSSSARQKAEKFMGTF